MSIRVLIADDDPLIREALEIILAKDPDFRLAAVVSNGQEAIEMCRSRRIDAAVLDIRMPVKDGVQAAEVICAETKTKVLILTTFGDERLVREAVAKGASGYILKGTGGDEIKNAVRMIAKGHTVFQDEVFHTMQAAADKVKADLAGCTEREQDVIRLISEGLSNKEISERLFLSEGTVKNHITAILTKLDLKQRTQIAVYYLTGKKPE